MVTWLQERLSFVNVVFQFEDLGNLITIPLYGEQRIMNIFTVYKQWLSLHIGRYIYLFIL